MSTQSQPTARRQPREMPSVVTKDRLSQIMQQEIMETGRVARQICQQSGSREILLKSAKKMAKQEIAMENTLTNLRQIEKLLEKSLEQANSIGETLEHTAVLEKQLADITGIWT